MDDYTKEQVEFWTRVGESDGFDVDHLMDMKPRSCSLVCHKFEDNDNYPTEIVLYARLGIHKYNMIQGTNLQLSSIEKFNGRPSTVGSGHYITLVAKDPAAGGSLVTFQTKVVEDDIDINSLTVSIARPKSEPRENPVNHGSVYDCAQVIGLPDENVFNDKKRYYVMKKSELRKHDWIRLYLELAFYNANKYLIKPDLSKLVIRKVTVETKENVKQPNESLQARNAVFYIRYRYYKNKGRAIKGHHSHKPPHDRVVIVKRTMDENEWCLAFGVH